MPSTTKRVVVYRWDRLPAQGIVNPASYLSETGIEWVTPDGHLQSSSFEECKALCFVSETSRMDLFSEHSIFERRPKMPGLWTRFFFRDETVLDGVLPHNLTEWPVMGYVFVPPQARANRQKVFIPRQSLMKTELRGVIGSQSQSLVRAPELDTGAADRQLTIFE